MGIARIVKRNLQRARKLQRVVYTYKEKDLKKAIKKDLISDTAYKTLQYVKGLWRVVVWKQV